MTKHVSLTRRAFIASSMAGGLAVGFHIPLAGRDAAAQGATPEINAWVVVKPDDTVVVRVARSEMGQGTLTGLCQLVAEELECDWRKVTWEYPTPQDNLKRGNVWGDMSTGGSRGIRTSVKYVREGGAAARLMLIEAAANAMQVQASECAAANGVVTHKGSGKSMRYGQVADAAAKLAPPKDIKLKDPKEWKVIGQPLARLDTAEKLDGSLVYAIDLKLPGMLNASIRQSPVFGGKVKGYEADKVKGMPGVKHVVQVGDNAVAIVADTWWQANEALKKLPITWDEGGNGNVSSESIKRMLTEGLDAKDTLIGQKVGDVDAGLKGAVKVIEATYARPYMHHVTFEPMTCTARMSPEKCEVWVSSQNGQAALAAASAASGLKPNQVEVTKHHLGGGFGRRGAFHDYVSQAVLIAKQIPGVPIKLIWSREEDMTHGFYHPTTMARLRGGLDKDGNLVALHMRLSGQSILAQLFPARLENGVDKLFFQGLLRDDDEWGYDIPNLLIDHAMRQTHVPVGFWRGVNHNQNAIYKECFLDELAEAAGQDPYEFRRKLLAKAPKHLAVLEAAAKKADWGKPLPEGVFRGICTQKGFGSYAANVVELSVSPRGKIKVHRCVCAIDCGYAVNPDQIAAQTEGGIAYGLHATLYSENTVKNGRIVEENFDTYPMMLIDEMPKVETVLVPSGGFWGGIGEPLTPLLAPAMLNALYKATGKRMRTLPLKDADLKRA